MSAAARHARSVARATWEPPEAERDTVCPYGRCRLYLDATTGRITGGMGPAGCPCDVTPGWRSPYPDGMGKPATPARVRGRNGSRVQRSRHRHADAWDAWDLVQGART